MTQTDTDRLHALPDADIAAMVRKYIEQEQINDPYFAGVLFEVDEKRIARRAEYVHVPVRPAIAPRYGQYVDSFLAHVNVQIVDEEHVPIFLRSEDAAEIETAGAVIP